MLSSFNIGRLFKKGSCYYLMKPSTNGKDSFHYLTKIFIVNSRALSFNTIIRMHTVTDNHLIMLCIRYLCCKTVALILFNKKIFLMFNIAKQTIST